jgi:hypothetical protein
MSLDYIAQRKAAVRLLRAQDSLERKLQDLVYLQHMHAAIVRIRRPLEPWEQPWDILRDVRDRVVVRNDSVDSIPWTFTECNSIALPPQLVTIGPKAR